MKVETDEKVNVEVKFVNNRFELFADNKYVFFVVNDETCSADFSFEDNYKYDENFARLIVDKLTINAD